MTDQKPYLIRAIYEWLADNGVRPHVMVDTTHPGVRVPPQCYEKTTGKPFEMFNLAMSATAELKMDNEVITCGARFGGSLFKLVLPIDAIAAIYTPDQPMSGQGMQFPYVRYRDRPQLTDPAAAEPPAEATAVPEPPAVKEKPSFLKVIK